jgi:hypothetical protein
MGPRADMRRIHRSCLKISAPAPRRCREMPTHTVNGIITSGRLIATISRMGSTEKREKSMARTTVFFLGHSLL